MTTRGMRKLQIQRFSIIYILFFLLPFDGRSQGRAASRRRMTVVIRGKDILSLYDDDDVTLLSRIHTFMSPPKDKETILLMLIQWIEASPLCYLPSERPLRLG